MDIKITPSRLSGTVSAISSKSDAHRKIIASALCHQPTFIEINEYSKDIDATLSAIKALGGDFEKADDGVRITPAKPCKSADVDCGESGSTARFLLPVAAVLCESATFTGQGRLPERPFSDLVREMKKNGCEINSDLLPITVSGGLRSGIYTLSGNVSSQYISGLLFALPLLSGESRIVLTSPLESAGYVEMTIDTLREFGVHIVKEENGYLIKPQEYKTKGRYFVEGDWSNGAFWIVADKLMGDVAVTGLCEKSIQGDKAIAKILEKTEIDAGQIPDLVPILSVLAAGKVGKTVIKNAGRLKLKESDRLMTTAELINSLGGEATYDDDSITITGCGKLSGGRVNGYGDHRIVMSAVVASCICENEVIVTGAEAVNKSYPRFFDDFKKLGGVFCVI